jgi:GNAT superfamily N-acetyltransferase
MAGWNDIPHLPEAEKRDMLKSIPPYQRDARTKGIPQLGAGAIYPIEESEITVEPFKIPRHFPRAFALDVGWKRTAALWGAFDREQDTWFLYAEHYRGQAEPSVHAAAIRAKGEWIQGAVDPAARGRGQDDGKKLIQQYRDLGLTIYEADHALEAGIQDCYERLSTGRIKVFSTLRNLLAEYRLYRRDEIGRIAETPDHLMDCMRYLVRTGPQIMMTEPVDDRYYVSDGRNQGRSRVGGY